MEFFVLSTTIARKGRGYEMIIVGILYLFLVLDCFSSNLRSSAQLLPEEEVQILETISSKLQNRYWEVSRSSCSDGRGLNWAFTSAFFSNVTCDCSFNSNTLCHVTNIQLRGLNLTGSLPAEFANLTHLRVFIVSRSNCSKLEQLGLTSQNRDLSRNYINGTIPASFARLPLTNLSLLGNRIGGTIPDEIGFWKLISLKDLFPQALEG